MADNIKVAVRVRPFNSRESERNSTCTVRMEGPKTFVTDPESGDEKTFTFDYSYWSHDSNDGHYADQSVVFNDLGKLYVENAWNGYNCSIFAYGQTGSGKSYSMMGYGEAKGIIPLGCENLFERIAANEDPSVTYRVEVSFLEIYNEKIRDLLNPKSGNNLRLREHPKVGPYVDKLSKTVVKNYDEISALMDEGNQVRTVGSTAMNATSSRSHSVFSVHLTKLTKLETGKEGETKSKVSLVDLAGSERAENTGATGQRLKEGCAINQSLSALGNVISALAHNAGRERNEKAKFVPFRDSKLTHLLKESLGGNSRTIMIAAISPASINYEETVSTLRYADRAKQIKTCAIVNEDPTAKLIRELQEEVAMLKAQLGGNAGTGEMSSEASKALESELKASQALIEEMSTTWEEKEKQSEELKAQRQNALKDMGISLTELAAAFAIDPKVTPYLQNVSDDPCADGVLVYYLKDGKVTLGKGPDGVDIALPSAALGIQEKHCLLEWTNGELFVEPATSGARINLNGMDVREKTRVLQSGSRLVLGRGTQFRVMIPAAETVNEEASAELTSMNNMIASANDMSEEIGKNVVYAADVRQHDVKGSAEDRTETVVKVTNHSSGEVDVWSTAKFSARFERMEDYYEDWVAAGRDISKMSMKRDPFIDLDEDALREQLFAEHVRPLEKKLSKMQLQLSAVTTAATERAPPSSGKSSPKKPLSPTKSPKVKRGFSSGSVGASTEDLKNAVAAKKKAETELAALQKKFAGSQKQVATLEGEVKKLRTKSSPSKAPSSSNVDSLQEQYKVSQQQVAYLEGEVARLQELQKSSQTGVAPHAHHMGSGAENERSDAGSSSAENDSTEASNSSSDDNADHDRLKDRIRRYKTRLERKNKRIQRLKHKLKHGAPVEVPEDAEPCVVVGKEKSKSCAIM